MRYRWTDEARAARIEARKTKKAAPVEVAGEVEARGTYRGVTANHAERRALGQRGHQRPPRRRELRDLREALAAAAVQPEKRRWGK